MVLHRTRWRLTLFILLVTLSVCLGGEINIRDKNSNTLLGVIRSITIGNQIYIPITDFADILSIPTTSNPITKKIELFYKQSKITFTAFTPFVKLDNITLQMSLEVLYPNGDFYVPLVDMIKSFELAGINTLSYNAPTQTVHIVMRQPNIIKLETIAQDDTVKLIFYTINSFQPKDIETIQDKEWIYFNINGGVIDKSHDWSLMNVPEIFEFIPTQTSMNKARIALHVAPNVMLEKVKIGTGANSIQVTLVRNPGISSAILAELQKEQEKWKIDVIIIDPGHGGKDAGCSAPGHIREKNIALAIAQKVKAELQRQTTAQVILTRERDVFIPLKGRTKKANQAGGKLFVSIHVDANRVKSLRGHTVYFLGPAKTDEAREVAQFENSVIQYEDSQSDYAGMSDAAFILAANAQNAYNKESEELASIIDQKLVEYCGSPSLGVRQAGFYVLYGASMPNILVETGFITNYSDRKKLVTSSYQSSLAKAIAEGILLFKNTYEEMPL